MAKASGIIIFIAGVAIGSAATWAITKKRYEQLAQEEIDSVKEAYANRGYRASNPGIVDETDGATAKTLSDKPAMMDYYNEKMREEGYTNYSNAKSEKEEEENVKKSEETIYPITSDSFGELDEYDTISLTRYSDGVIADEYDEPVVNSENVVGVITDEMFAESDEIYIRNDEMKADYEILRENSAFYNNPTKK